MPIVRPMADEDGADIAPRRRRVVLCAGAGAIASLVLRFSASANAVTLDRDRLESSMSSRFGEAGVQALHQWFSLLDAQAARPLNAQLVAINEFWNRIVAASDDLSVWGQVDYWATPLESLGKRAGDCDDYVIGKYFSLLHLRVPTERLRFIYVRARIGGSGSTQSIAHMVLGYYATPQAEPLVLDSLTSDILPATERPDLIPVFSFNGQGIYLPGRQPTPADRISRWPDLLARMQQEGFLP